MNKQELREAIHEGIGDVVGDFGKALLWGAGIFLGAVLILYIIFNVIIPQPQVQVGAPSPSLKCNSEILDCSILNLSIKEVPNSENPYYPRIYKKQICGYEEANAFFNYYNSTYGQNSKLEMKCE